MLSRGVVVVGGWCVCGKLIRTDDNTLEKKRKLIRTDDNTLKMWLTSLAAPSPAWESAADESHDESALCSLQQRSYDGEFRMKDRELNWKYVSVQKNTTEYNLEGAFTWRGRSRASVSKGRPHFHNRGRMFSSLARRKKTPSKFWIETQRRPMYKRYNDGIPTS